MKLTKKEAKEIRQWVGDYFCEVIMPVCFLAGYKVYTHIKEDGKNDFSIKVNFPYRSVRLYIEQGGVEHYKNKDWEAIRFVLFHEAFHLINWKFREYAGQRFIAEDVLDNVEEDVADKFAMIVDYLWKQNNETNKPRKNKKN